MYLNEEQTSIILARTPESSRRWRKRAKGALAVGALATGAYGLYKYKQLKKLQKLARKGPLVKAGTISMPNVPPHLLKKGVDPGSLGRMRPPPSLRPMRRARAIKTGLLTGALAGAGFYGVTGGPFNVGPGSLLYGFYRDEREKGESRASSIKKALKPIKPFSQRRSR